MVETPTLPYGNGDQEVFKAIKTRVPMRRGGGDEGKYLYVFSEHFPCEF